MAAGLPGRDMGFSSYYGQLSSDDDFYLVAPTNLTILQVCERRALDLLPCLLNPGSPCSFCYADMGHHPTVSEA